VNLYSNRGNRCFNIDRPLPLEFGRLHMVRQPSADTHVIDIAILLQRPVYCFWRADFHGQGATRVTPDNFMFLFCFVLLHVLARPAIYIFDITSSIV
jgi:hypothetical protein